jgi:hypothetical protein
MKNNTLALAGALALALALCGCATTSARKVTSAHSKLPPRSPVELSVSVVPANAEVWLLARGLGDYAAMLDSGAAIGQKTMIPARDVDFSAVLFVHAPGYVSQAIDFRPRDCSTFAIVLRPMPDDFAGPTTPAEQRGDEVTLASLSAEDRGAELAAREAARIRSLTKRVGDFELYWEYVPETRESRYTRLSGTVKNVGTCSVARIPVRADIWDADAAEVINSDWTFAVDTLPLRPGETRRWELMVAKPTPRISVSLGQPMDRL